MADYQILANCRGGKLIFRNPQTFYKIICEKDNEEVVVSIKSTIRLKEKQKLYNFFHSIIIDCTIRALTRDGWAGVDEAFAEHYLKTNCAKGIIHNNTTNKDEVFLLEKKAMNLERLYKFVNDCIFLLEERHGEIVPDSEEWKMNQAKYKK